ncbi:MAG: HPP family protein [Amaricoccus sp.]
MLLAPFGASGVLVFGVPNSPLAQPWSAIVGNTVSALVAVVTFVPEPAALRVVLATGLAVVAMHLARALHPPGGAVALTAALNPDLVRELGPLFALAPIGLGTACMVVLACVFAPLTGRRYPFRIEAEVNAHGTTDPNARDRLPISRAELGDILREFRQSPNIGVEDLARLVAAAERRVAAHDVEGVTAAYVMSRDLVTVGPEASLVEVADLFRRHAFTSIPVVEGDMRYLGVIFQIHLIRHGREEMMRLRRRSLGTRRDPSDDEVPVVARDLMSDGGPSAAGDAPLSALIPLLAEGDCDAVPILAGDRIDGIVTRTDLIAALARRQPRSLPA